MMQKIDDCLDLLHQREKEDQQRSLLGLREALGIREEDPHVDTTKYKAHLDYTFSDFVTRYQDSCMMTWGRFSSDQKVSGWLSSNRSQILVACGRTSGELSHTGLSWLSHAAIMLARGEHFEPSHLKISVYYFCQTSSTIRATRRPSFQRVLANWGYQLAVAASSRAGIPSNKLDDIRNGLCLDNWSTSVEMGLSKALDAIVRLLSCLEESTTVTFILDRADECFLENSDDYDIYELNMIMEWLIQLVSRPHCLTKVLVTLHPVGYGNMGHRLKIKAATNQGLYIERLDWDQNIL